MSRLLNNPARTFGVVAALSAACTFAMAISVPYRIHQGVYSWYLWTECLLPFTGLTALVTTVSAFVLGISSRQRLPIILAVMTCTLLFLCIGQWAVHSGPNPQAWCYSNLRKIEAAKQQFASEKQLPSGTAITGAHISSYIDRGFDALVCAEHGTYTIGSNEMEPRCSFHGSMTEMEHGWQKRMHQ